MSICTLNRSIIVYLAIYTFPSFRHIFLIYNYTTVPITYLMYITKHVKVFCLRMKILYYLLFFFVISRLSSPKLVFIFRIFIFLQIWNLHYLHNLVHHHLTFRCATSYLRFSSHLIRSTFIFTRSILRI